MKTVITAILLAWSCAVQAQDVLVLGEVHDNPAHHLAQAREVAALGPKAVIYEMLTRDQADGAVFDTGDEAALASVLQWAESGWPEFAMYYPLFAAAPKARIYGAGLPRDAARAAIEGSVADVFGPEAAAYGLEQPLSEDQQAAREALQFEAHCRGLPKEIMPGMVAIQRLRDAMLARAVRRALRETGGPVAVITGNGHARRDWGMPAVLALVAPEADIRVIGQTEDSAPLAGVFDVVLSSAAVARPDPCAAFR